MRSGSRMKAIGLVLHPTKPVDRSIDTILEGARGHPVRVLAREHDRHRVPSQVQPVPDSTFVAEVDIVIALGGDGTMLGAMRMMIERPVPVLGVNYGDLGFLVEVTPEGLPAALERLTRGDFTLEQHACLEVNSAGVDPASRFGFNDVVLRQGDGKGTVSVDLTVDDLRYGYYRGDAVVISTPTGSTAYNYAAGGPVLSPSSDAIVITPVAPMSGISRPVVLGVRDEVRFTAASDGTPIAVDIDGTSAGELVQGQWLTAVIRQDAAQVVRLSASEHAQRSRVRLSLLDLPLRPDQLLELIPPDLRRNAEAALSRNTETARRSS
ncbi:NAD kinase [Actinomadura sp. NBRC 104412]|uniref:NAD(+)/NADH kinase n=1 Tax=Actinomadura sp. NBRC 104412 TaxID=3032203 RepID=UPI0024A33202|nr:NAD(+)/NADH kinase [Actinomadura sp. NBRC 104412]GLZ06630.1 NAD kinase [Actinomadura sp. NBRC 104412]